MTCFYCGASLSITVRPRTGLRATKDHIYPRSMVRSLSPQQKKALPANFSTMNTVDCCSGCNSMKGQLHPLDWLVIMPNAYNAARLAERMVKMGENMEEVFDAMQRRRKK